MEKFYGNSGVGLLEVARMCDTETQGSVDATIAKAGNGSTADDTKFERFVISTA